MKINFCYMRALVLLSVILPVTLSYAADPLGKTLLARGAVTAERGGANTALKRLSPVFRQDILRSGNSARAQFRMIDDAYINLQQNSVLRLEQYELKSGTQEKSNVVMELISGGLRTITGAVGKQDKKDYQLKTPVATIGIRGTMYEVEIVPEGMYVAAWEGRIWIRSHSGNCDLTLGDSLPFRFVLVNNAGECQALRVAPKIFRDGHSSDTVDSTELAEVITNNVTNNPLLGNPRQTSFKYSALLMGLDNGFVLNGQAESINSGDTLLLVDNVVVSLGEGVLTGFSQEIGGYPLSWGRWATDGNELLWTAYQATDPATVDPATDPTDLMSRQGTVRYENMVGSLAQSNMGAVSNVAVQMDVNFDNGAVTNGAVSANVPGYTWAGVFDGQVQSGDLSLEFNGGSLVDSTTGAFTNVNGDINGDFIGNNAQAIVGGFSMIDTTESLTDTQNHINGVFLVE